jgi:hypothetical protein
MLIVKMPHFKHCGGTSPWERRLPDGIFDGDRLYRLIDTLAELVIFFWCGGTTPSVNPLGADCLAFLPRNAKPSAFSQSAEGNKLLRSLPLMRYGRSQWRLSRVGNKAQ